jgi:hypothetical protein
LSFSEPLASPGLWTSVVQPPIGVDEIGNLW